MMPALPQFDYVFAIGTIFAFLDAWNIGRLLSYILRVTGDLEISHKASAVSPNFLYRLPIVVPVEH